MGNPRYSGLSVSVARPITYFATRWQEATGPLELESLDEFTRSTS